MCVHIGHVLVMQYKIPFTVEKTSRNDTVLLVRGRGQMRKTVII